MKFTLFPLLSLSLLRTFSTAVLVNNTFDDSNTAIIYEPFDSHNWFSNATQECPQCPSLDKAIDRTYHYGLHVVPPDNDDNPTDIAVANPEDPDAGPHDNDDEHGGRGGKGGGDSDGGKKKGDGDSKRSLWRREDADDPNFADTSVNATLTFTETGTGVYVYCIVPTAGNGNTTNPLISNMSFILDGTRLDSDSFIFHPPNGATTQYNFSQLVFARSGLANGQEHILTISPQLNSIIMLDAINVTTDSIGTSGQNTTAGQNAPDTSSPTSGPKKKDVETFAVAIGSTTGVLAVLSFIVATSIYLRRRRSAKRNKLLEAQEQSLRPEMSGPQPFIPRYFPGSTASPQQSSDPSTSIDPSISRRSSRSSMGPSHGLNYPVAPEIPAYSSVAPANVEMRLPLPVSVSARAPVVRLPDDDDVVPPSYQEVAQTTLLSPSTVGQQPAPSLSELSPTQHPLILSSEARTSLEDDTDSITPLAAHLSGIPLILDEDDDIVARSRRRGANSIPLHRTRPNNSDGPPR